MADPKVPADIAQDDELLKTRLRRFFDAEVESAGDPRSLRPTRQAGGQPIRSAGLGWRAAAMALAVLLVSLTAFGALNRPERALPSEPDRAAALGSPKPSEIPAASAGSTPRAPGRASDVTFHGVPSRIDGLPVLSGEALVQHLEDVADSEPFLVAGFVTVSILDCDVPAGAARSPLVEPCAGGGFQLHHSVEPGESPLSIIFLDRPLPGGHEWREGGPMVLRVHTHDPLAASCDPRIRDPCDRAVVVDAIKWPAVPLDGEVSLNARHPDGIPSTLEGEPVLRASEGVTTARLAMDGRSRLVGGWFSRGDFVGCDAVWPASAPPLPEAHWLAPSCERGYRVQAIADLPYRLGRGAWEIVLDPELAAIPEGPVVLRIHSPDRQAVECAPELRERCFDSVVVEAVSWSGDQLTQTNPLTISEVVLGLEGAGQGGRSVPNFAVLPRPPASLPTACRVPFPPQTWRVVGEPRLGLVLVFPDEQALDAALPALSGWPEVAGARCAAEHPEQPRHWEVVQNVLVEVVGDDPAFERRISDALRGVPVGEFDADVLPAWAQETVAEDSVRSFLETRAAGACIEAFRRIDVLFLDPSTLHADRRFTLDCMRRQRAAALDFDPESVSPVPLGDYVGREVIARMLSDSGVDPASAVVITVNHPDSTDPTLRNETFVVEVTPTQGTRPFLVDAAPYPEWPPGE